MRRHLMVVAPILLRLLWISAGLGAPARVLAANRVSSAPSYLSQFGALWSVTVDPRGHVFVLDRDSSRVLKLSSTGHVLKRWSVPPIRIPNQPADLTGITLGPHHTLYLTDAFNYQVVTISKTGQVLASWDTRHAKNRRPVGPFGVARDAQGNLYVPNFAFSDVEKYSPTGKRLMSFGHACAQAPGSDTTTNACMDQGHLSLGELNHPDSIALDPQGNIYVSDHRSKRIVKFGPDGKEIASFGPDLPAPYGSFGLTEGVVVDREGNIYVEDRSGPRVVKLSPAGVPVAQWQAPKGYAAEGTPGIDAAGNLYFTLNADTKPCVVVKLSPDLQVLARWK